MLQNIASELKETLQIATFAKSIHEAILKQRSKQDHANFCSAFSSHCQHSLEQEANRELIESKLIES